MQFQMHRNPIAVSISGDWLNPSTLGYFFGGLIEKELFNRDYL